MITKDATDLLIESKVNFIKLATLLWRGGSHAYFWVKNGDDKKTIWFDKKKAPSIPAQNLGDVYYGVFATLGKKEHWQRATINDIAALTAFFAEFDVKDYGSIEAVLTHISTLDYSPTALVYSGGGVHAYWVFETPFFINEESDTAYASAALAHWVEYAGGDKGAKDLARVLRVPSTENHKYTPRKPVLCLDEDCDFSRLYDYKRLIETAELAVGRKLFETVEKPIDVKPIKAASSDTRYRQYALAALRNVTAEMSSAPDGTQNNTLFDKALLLAGYIPHGLLTRAEIEQQLEAAAHACGYVQWKGIGATRATIKSGIDRGIVKPLDLPQFENLPPSKASQGQMPKKPEITVGDFDRMYQSSDDVYQALLDEIDGLKVRQFEPIMLPYTPIHQFGGFAEYVHPGNIVFIVSSAGFGKTAFIDMLRERYTQIGIDSMWDGPEWQAIDMGVRALHRAGKLSFRDYTQYLLFAGDKARGVPLHQCRGNDLTIRAKDDAKEHVLRMRDEWPGKTFYITPEPMDFEQRLNLYDYVLKTERGKGHNPRLHFMDYVNLMARNGDWSELDMRVVAPYQEWLRNNQLVGFIVVQAKREAFSIVKNGGTLDESHLQGLSPQKCKLLIALTPALSPTGEKLDYAVVTVGKNNTGKTGSVKVKNTLSEFVWSEEIVK